MVMRVLILIGGTVEENFAKDYISKWNPDQVITADKGLLYAKRLNIKPDIIIYNDEIIEKWKRRTLRLCELSSEVIVEK